MKILRIRLKNLNSLKGEHCVDLTAEPLASAGLFAITGSMGAGKSTLLDAVTLALYGKAARYGNESNPEHVMSRHCGECSAEVEFEVPSGTYRAVWERHRSRKRPDGALQQPKRYIYDNKGQPLAQQIREAELKIEELLGLNYDRFLRSVLLAQGEFARFLKADSNERAELLESLTGTEVYSRLGRLAFEEANRRENDLKAKEAGLEQIAVLGDEARQEIELAVMQGEEARGKLEKEIQSGSDMVGKIASLEGARVKEKDANDEQAKITKDTQAAAPDLERLRRHQLTLPFTEDLARLDASEKVMELATQQEKKAVANHATAKKELHNTNHIVRASIAAALQTQRERATKAGENLQKETKAAADARIWLNEHQHDAVLADQLGDLVAAIGELKSGRALLAGNWYDWRSVASQILPKDARSLPENIEGTKDAELKTALDKFLGQAGTRKETLEAELKEAKKQLGLRNDHLEKAKLIAKLEDHRHELKSGEPCPLCGALEHPYATGAAPSNEIAELQTEVRKAGDKLEAVTDAKRTLSSSVEDLTKESRSLITSVRDCDTQLEALERLLQPLAVKAPSHGKEDALRTGLKEREVAYRTHVKAEDDAIKRRAEAERAAKGAGEESVNLERKIEKLGPLPAGLEFEPVEAEDLPSVTDAEEAYSSAVLEEKTTATQARDRIADVKAALEKLDEMRRPLEAWVAGTEFQTLANLRTARITAEAVKKIEALESGLKQRTNAAEALLQQARKDISKLLDEKVLEGEAAALFKSRQIQMKKEGETMLVGQTTRRNQIKTDDDNREVRKKKEKELEQDRTSLVVWKRLRELIGSHDGSKFRRYAQTISLDVLTRHANRHLAKLSDRYRVCRDEQEALNLQIEDLHQAGVRRPMASLSGGESFLASLALALGLSDLAGRTVRIDSLFIDEGFGSLDPETLEIAIAALESLRQNHKTVGVISHVALLKERISTQIVVEKMAGGVSHIRVIPEYTAS